MGLWAPFMTRAMPHEVNGIMRGTLGPYAAALFLTLGALLSCLVLIYGRAYWDRIVNWKEMVRAGAINQREHNLLQFADTVDDAFRHIKRGLEKFHVFPDTLTRESV